MTMPLMTESVCYICGKKSEQTVLASTNSFGSPDLDLRPPQMQRSTMQWWVHECPYCGYVSNMIDDETGVSREWLNSEKYRTADGIAFSVKLAFTFYRLYLKSIADNKPEEAFRAALHAAWVCDDSDEDEQAVICRKAALEQLDIVIGNGKKEDTETYRVMRMDILRRAGLFERVTEEYSDVVFSNEATNTIKAFQIKHSQQGDTRCYTIAACAKEMKIDE